MKFYIITLFLFITWFNYSQNNIEGEIYYKKRIEVSLDFEDETPMNLMHIERTKDIINELKLLNYYLLINNNKSMFKIEDEMEVDKKKKINLGKLIGGGNGIYYTNMSDNILIHQKESFGKLFLVEHKISDIQWDITNETKNIIGYNCIKAKTEIRINTRDGIKNQRIEAWFTPEINSSTGPIGLGGLPGLILELKKGNFVFYAYKIILNNSTNKKITQPTEGFKLSKKEFDSISNEMFIKRGTF